MNKPFKINKKFLILSMLSLLLLNSIVFAAGTPVNVTGVEVKDIDKVQIVNSVIEPYKSINVSSKTGGIIERVNVSIGKYVEKGEILLKFEQDDIKIQVQQAEAALAIAKANHEKLLKGATDEQVKIAETGVKQAEAALQIAEANYKMMKDGATTEDIAAVKAQYQQAKSSYQGAKDNLDLLQKMYDDRTMQKQQLVGADTQFKSAKKQVEVAEERLQQAKIGLEQAKNGLNQAENEYNRIKYLYQENVATKKQYEMVETQYENAKAAVQNAQSAVESARIARDQAELSYQGAEKNYNLTEDSFNNPTQLKQQLAGAETQLNVAESNVEMARANLDKVEKGAREEELATARGNVAQAQSALDRAKAQLAQVKKGATEEDIKISEANIKQSEAVLKQAKKALEDSIIKSPFSGIIAAVNFEEGEMAGPGTPLVSLVNLDKVYVKAEVTADLLVNINKGEEARVKILAYDDKSITGTVEYISPVADPRSQAFTVKVLLDNPDRIIKGGMFADVYFTTDTDKNVMVLPFEAVQDIESDPYVYIISGGKAVRKSIELGIINDEEISIINGISKNDQVIVRGQNSISDGDPVEVVE